MPKGTIIPQLLMFNRFDVDQVTMIDKKGRKWTQREIINEELKKEGYSWRRKDIAMINLTRDGKHFQQFTVEPMANGEPAWGGCSPYLLKEEKDAIREINRKCIETEKKEGWPEGTLTFKRRTTIAS